TSSPPPAPPSRGLPLPLHQPFWTYALLVAIGLMFLLETVLPRFANDIVPYFPSTYVTLSLGDSNRYILILLGANSKPLILAGQVWRFFMSMFLHIGLTHLFFNAYALFIFGVEMERVFGKARFLTIYILSGLLASFASFLNLPSDYAISAGASGAIFGIVGMEAAYFFIGGLISGALLAYVMLPNYKITETSFGQPRVIDRSSFQTWIWAPVAAVAVLFVGSYVTIWLR
ncbi:MAG: hypothetical protein B6I38_10100, partial [Anaerolineaceae bacterium 4572_5.1]